MANSILGGLNQEATQGELLFAAAYYLSAILERMPRVDANDKLLVSHAESNPTVSIAASQTLATLTTAGTLQNLGAASRPADAVPMHLANVGALHLYDRLFATGNAMPMTANLRKMMHRKSIEYPAANPAGNTAAGTFVVSDKSDVIPGHDTAYYVGGVSAIWNYNADQDAWMQLPNSGAAGTFAAGACGEFRAISAPAGAITNTATAGTTTTLTTGLNLARNLAGCRIRIVGGTGSGYEGTITGNTLGASAVITVSPASGTAFSATTQYRIFAGSMWFMNAGTTAVGFVVYDRATNTWTARSVTNLPTAWGTDAQLVSTPSCSSNSGSAVYSGTATAGDLTSLTNSGATWGVNALARGKVTITGGTGAGQWQWVASNTATVITLEGNWIPVQGRTAVAPDTTSTYQVTGLGFVQSLVTAGAATSLTDSTKTWATNAWVNYQVRIVAGTGAGQIRAITASTATTLTVAAWTTNPDTTSVYRIEGNDDYLYLLGNAAVTLYRYSISGNAWSTLTPAAARGAAPGAGMTADWIDGVPDADWQSGTSPAHYSTTVLKQNGRYLYSFRGAATAVLDLYDIAANTWISGVAYGNQMETFTTGSCSVDIDGQIYLQKDATGRVYKFDVAKNCLDPFLFNPVPQSTAVAGDKMFLATQSEGGSKLTYLYSLANTKADMARWLIV